MVVLGAKLGLLTHDLVGASLGLILAKLDASMQAQAQNKTT